MTPLLRSPLRSLLCALDGDHNPFFLEGGRGYCPDVIDQDQMTLIYLDDCARRPAPMPSYAASDLSDFITF